MADSAVDSVKAVCVYCRNKVVKSGVQCKNCAQYLHTSCSTRKQCCDKQLLHEIEAKSASAISLEDVNEDPQKIVIKALVYENQLLTDLNQELNLNNQLLLEKIHNLEFGLNENISGKVKPETHKIKEFAGSQINKGDSKQKKQVDNNAAPLKPVGKNHITKSVNKQQEELLVSKQSNLSHDNIHLGNETAENSLKTGDDEGFKTYINKRNLKKSTQVAGN